MHYNTVYSIWFHNIQICCAYWMHSILYQKVRKHFDNCLLICLCLPLDAEFPKLGAKVTCNPTAFTWAYNTKNSSLVQPLCLQQSAPDSTESSYSSRKVNSCTILYYNGMK